MRTTGKRMLSILLCLCMAACMLPTVAFAADTGKAIQLGTDALSKEEAVTVERIQAMIDALPGAEEITEDNAEEVKAQLEAIDEAKAQLSDEELDQLDSSLYTEAASALGGLAKPMLTDSPKKISVRWHAKNGDITDSVSGGVPTAYGTTHTLTVTPNTGCYVIAGYFAGTDYYKTNPAKHQYSNMTLDKISEADPQTRAVQYRFTATEVIPSGNDDYICLYFHCAKLPTLLWPFGNISGEATAPSTDGNTAARPYVSQEELCGDPNEYTGYYSLADKKDRPYLEWQVISITDKEGNTAGGTVAFDNNHLTYTPTADEAGKTVTITIRPKLGYVEEANTPLSFEIEVKKPVVEQSEFYVTMVIDGYGNAVARPNSAKEGEEIQLIAIPNRGHHFKEWQATSGDIMITNDKFTMPAENVTVKAIFEANTYTVTLHPNGGTINNGNVTGYTYGVGATLPTADDMTYTGHTFKGWYDNEGLTGDPVTAIGGTEMGNKEYWAKWEINQYTITYDLAGGTAEGNLDTYTVETGAFTLKNPTKSGYTFTGWYADKDLTEKISTIKMTSNKTVYAGWEATGVPDWLNGADHFAYIIGDDEGYVRPLANVTRAETAAIFFRLLKEDVREEYLTDRSGFADVEQGAWYNKAVSTMAALGVVKGYTEDMFAPHEAITRAEFAAICARFDTGTSDGESSFTDISGHWAESEIRRAAQLGWIQGDPDGRFRPNAPITRAETMTIINRVLNRLPEEKEDLLAGMKEWPDALPGAWYYLAVQEATNSHYYEFKTNSQYEKWTELRETRDWTQLEK